MKGSFEPETLRVAGDIAIAPLLVEMGAYRIIPDLGFHLPIWYFTQVDMDKTEGPQIIVLMKDTLERGIRFGHDLAPAPTSRRGATRCFPRADPRQSAL